jgi:small subunit ribosomal protein S20
MLSDIIIGGYTLAQHKSAAKRARQSVKKNAINTSRKSKVRTGEKTLLKAIKDKDAKAVKTLLSEYTSQMMKAAQKGAFKKANATRKIGRLSAAVHKAFGAAK